MIVIHSMMTYAKTASRWSRRTAPIAASARRKMDANFGDMPGAGWSNGSSPGLNGSAASLSAGSSIRRTSLASCNSLASSSSSNDFEIGSSRHGRLLSLLGAHFSLHALVEPADAHHHALVGAAADCLDGVMGLHAEGDGAARAASIRDIVLNQVALFVLV